MARAPGKRKAAAPNPAPYPPVFYSLHALLHTVRVIQAHEDQLCTFLHELRTARTLSPAVVTELIELVEAMPTWEYQDDLQAVRSALAGKAGSPHKHLTPTTRRGVKPVAKRRTKSRPGKPLRHP